jgi:hypothetical protein
LAFLNLFQEISKFQNSEYEVPTSSRSKIREEPNSFLSLKGAEVGSIQKSFNDGTGGGAWQTDFFNRLNDVFHNWADEIHTF